MNKKSKQLGLLDFIEVMSYRPLTPLEQRACDEIINRIVAKSGVRRKAGVRSGDRSPRGSRSNAGNRI